MNRAAPDKSICCLNGNILYIQNNLLIYPWKKKEEETKYMGVYSSTYRDQPFICTKVSYFLVDSYISFAMWKMLFK